MGFRTIRLRVEGFGFTVQTVGLQVAPFNTPQPSP